MGMILGPSLARLDGRPRRDLLRRASHQHPHPHEETNNGDGRSKWIDWEVMLTFFTLPFTLATAVKNASTSPSLKYGTLYANMRSWAFDLDTMYLAIYQHLLSSWMKPER